MAEVKKAKVVRTNKMAAFTRKRNHLQQLIDGGAQGSKLKEAYGELADAFKTLESVHEELMLVIEEEQMEAESSYLDTAAGTLSQMDLRVSQAAENQDKVAKDSEREEENQRKLAEEEADRKSKCERAKAAFRTGVEAFGKPSANLLELSTAKTISFSDMRAEMSKLEESCAELLKKKEEILTLEPDADIGAFNDMFNSLVNDEVDRCKRVALEYLKDTPEVVTVPTSDSVSESGSSSRIHGFSQTKRETVMLPKFSGDEKTAFLKYPVWKTQWLSH